MMIDSLLTAPLGGGIRLSEKKSASPVLHSLLLKSEPMKKGKQLLGLVQPWSLLSQQKENNYWCWGVIFSFVASLQDLQAEAEVEMSLLDAGVAAPPAKRRKYRRIEDTLETLRSRLQQKSITPLEFADRVARILHEKK